MRTIVAAAFFVSCAGPAAERPRPREAAATAPATAPASAPSVSGALARAEVDSVLDAGIPRFLSSVDTSPAMADGRFLGFRVLSFTQGDARFSAGPVLRGDVVVAVNGLPIERPEHLFRIWQELRVASSLSVDVLRGGQPRRMTWAIE